MEPDLRAAFFYAEPFVGGASVLCRVTNRPAFASDANQALISLWQALQAGWEPPLHVTEEDYAAAKGLSDTNPLKAFIGIGCSFAGKWFGGYARGGAGRNYAANAANSLKKKLRTLSGVNFVWADYAETVFPLNAVVYCDPPYAGTTGYAGTEAFDWNRFWLWVRETAQGRVVYVSEYSAPADISLVAEFQTNLDIRTTQGKEPRIERLYRCAL